MNEAHKVENIRFDNNFILLTIDLKEYKIDLSQHSPKLATSPDSIKYKYDISPSGYGIHWPDLDEDLSIDGLLGIKHTANLKSKVS